MSNKKVFYFHIPKTAGTTVASLLDEHFNNTLHHIEGQPITPEFLNKYDVVSGHVTYTHIEKILDLSQWVTIATFREPYSHIASHINWVRKLADKGEEQRFSKHPKDFQDLALYMKTLNLSYADDIKELIKYFSQTDFHYFYNTQTLYMDKDKRLDIAIKNLGHINIIGLTETMGAFKNHLHSFFEWRRSFKSPKKLNKNTSNYGLNIADTETREALYPLIDKDLFLYDEAVKKSFKEEWLKYKG